MKQGKRFEDVVQQVKQDAAMRHDFYCPTSEMMMMSDADGSKLATPGGQFEMRDRAHLHLAELTGVDRRYYQRMRNEAPHLLDRNVNHWLANTPPKQRIVRAHDNDARAIVSSRFAMLDNDALLAMVQPVIDEMNLTVESCDISEERLFIKMISPRLRGAVKVGDDVQGGLIIRNSEVGFSAVQIDWFVSRLLCTNGLIISGPNGRGASRRHVGRNWGAPNGSSNTSFSGPPHNNLLYPKAPFSFGPIPDNAERQQWEKAIWGELQISLRNSLNANAFTDLLERLSFTTSLRTDLGLDEVAERVSNTFHLRPGEHTSMLYHLSRDEDVAHNGASLWSVVNAVTRTAEDVEAYDRSTELEALGGTIAHLSRKAWERLVSRN